jgi:hypothetical protein
MCFAQDEARLDAALDRITAALADASYREIHEEVPDGGRDAQ